MSMKFSYEAAWADIVALWRAHGEFLAILAGLFLMIPDFTRNLFIPVPEITGFDRANLDILQAYFEENGIRLFLLGLPPLVGSATILSLMVDVRRPTVGQALGLSLRLLPGIFVLNLLMQIAILGGMFLFIIPGVYLIGRFAAASSWQMAHRAINPFTALARSFDLTRGSGWSIAGLVLIFGLTGAIAVRAVEAVLGIAISFVIPTMSIAAVSAFLSSIASAIYDLALLMLGAAIYRQCAPMVK